MAIRAYQYRLYPTKAQEEALQVQLDVSPHVYNMAQVAIEDLDRAFQAFFRRVKVSGVGRTRVLWHIVGLNMNVVSA